MSCLLPCNMQNTRIWEILEFFPTKENLKKKNVKECGDAFPAGFEAEWKYKEFSKFLFTIKFKNKIFKNFPLDREIFLYRERNTLLQVVFETMLPPALLLQLTRRAKLIKFNFH